MYGCGGTVAVGHLQTHQKPRNQLTFKATPHPHSTLFPPPADTTYPTPARITAQNAAPAARRKNRLIVMIKLCAPLALEVPASSCDILMVKLPPVTLDHFITVVMPRHI
jgi:hypothetical protein